jgi:SAM-dependent methyltransferase
VTERHDPRNVMDAIGVYQDAHHKARYRWAVDVLRDVRGPVVDIACGSGYGSHMLAEAGHAVIGIDTSESAVAEAARVHRHASLTFRRGDAEDLSDFADASIAAVVSFETIEHLHRPRTFLAEIHRVLAPGGVLLLSTPNRLLASTMYPVRGKPNNPYHVFEYTLNEFKDDVLAHFPGGLLRGQGFVPSWMAFWPVQVGIKAVASLLRPVGAYRWVDRWYHDPTHVDVQSLESQRLKTASNFLAECRRT